MALSNEDSDSMNMAALTAQQMAEILTKAGAKTATVESIEQDIANGCPVDDNGRLHAVTYAAWLAKQAVENGH